MDRHSGMGVLREGPDHRFWSPEEPQLRDRKYTLLRLWHRTFWDHDVDPADAAIALRLPRHRRGARPWPPRTGHPPARAGFSPIAPEAARFREDTDLHEPVFYLSRDVCL